jgi:anti-sigma B factor antagonist
MTTGTTVVTGGTVDRIGQQLHLETHPVGTWTVVGVSGEIDVATSTSLQEALDTSLSDQTRVVVDLSGVTFLDSTGLGVLLRAHKRAESTDGELKVVVRHQNVRRVFEVTGLLDVLAVCDSVGEATEGTDGMAEGASPPPLF